MKCVNCGKKTEDRILCSSCMNTEISSKYAMTHVCQSYQKKDDVDGVCKNVLSCEVIKKAILHESLITSIGHITCPYASLNISYITYKKFTEDEREILKTSIYKECFK